MSDVRWLTYVELGEALGITPDSARRLVARKKNWPRKTNNEGRALIGVPTEYLEREKPTPIAVPDATHAVTRGDGADITHAVMVLTQHIERLEKELATARERAADRDSLAVQLDALRTALNEMRAERNRWHSQAERLAAPRAATVPSVPAANVRRAWWSWLRSA